MRERGREGGREREREGVNESEVEGERMVVIHKGNSSVFCTRHWSTVHRMWRQWRLPLMPVTWQHACSVITHLVQITSNRMLSGVLLL